jgi:hypothetical protein
MRPNRHQALDEAATAAALGHGVNRQWKGYWQRQGQL